MFHQQVVVNVANTTPGRLDVIVNTSKGTTKFYNIPTTLSSPTTISTQLDANYSQTTIVSQSPRTALPASLPPNTIERLHVFSDGHKTTLVLPLPNLLLSLDGDLLKVTKGTLKAPMPSLVVKLGDRVEKGQAIIVWESRKTKTVLRADAAGAVKAVGCKNGEIVEEGWELVEIEGDEVEPPSP